MINSGTFYLKWKLEQGQKILVESEWPSGLQRFAAAWMVMGSNPPPLLVDIWSASMWIKMACCYADAAPIPWCLGQGCPMASWYRFQVHGGSGTPLWTDKHNEKHYVPIGPRAEGKKNKFQLMPIVVTLSVECEGSLSVIFLKKEQTLFTNIAVEARGRYPRHGALSRPQQFPDWIVSVRPPVQYLWTQPQQSVLSAILYCVSVFRGAIDLFTSFIYISLTQTTILCVIVTNRMVCLLHLSSDIFLHIVI